MKYKSKAEIFSLESAKKYIKTEQSAQKWEHRTILPEKSKAVKKKKRGPGPERRSGPGPKPGSGPQEAFAENLAGIGDNHEGMGIVLLQIAAQ